MHFHILFHLHIFLKNTNNITKTTLPNSNKIIMTRSPSKLFSVRKIKHVHAHASPNEIACEFRANNCANLD